MTTPASRRLATRMILLASLLLLHSSSASASTGDDLERSPQTARAEGAIDEGDPRVVSTLIMDHDQASPGQTIAVGVHFALDPGWHLYWERSGEAGLPTQLTWTVEGAQAQVGPMRWPAPSTFVEGDGQIITYGYSEQVLHEASLTIPLDAPRGELLVRVTADYLTCAQICIPGRVQMSRALRVGQRAVPSASAERFAQARLSLPRRASQPAHARWLQRDARVSRVALEVMLCDQPNAAAGCPEHQLDATPVEHAFIPETSEREPWRVEHIERLTHDPARLRVTLAAPRAVEATQIAGVLRLRAGGQPHPLSLSASLEAPQASAAPSAPLMPAASSPLTPAASSEAPGGPGAIRAAGAPGAPDAPDAPDAPASLWLMVGMALLGGLLLNVMPCVFPVLTLKIASLATLSQQDARVARAHGLAYLAGIQSTMGAMTLVILGLKAAGAQVGWGFQLQSPTFLVGLSAALVLFALNLFGVFEVWLPGAGRLSALARTRGLAQSWAEGLLCVLLSTPCSAPFMGTAMGFALTSDAATTLLLFMALGLGLGAPFVALAFAPSWRRFLPKPGDWLLHLKHFLGFTLLGTTLWLLWILGSSFGAHGMTRALGGLLALSLAAWLYGLVQHRAGKARVLVSLLAVAIASAAAWTALRLEPTHQAPAGAGDPSARAQTLAQDTDAHGWQPYSPARVHEALSQGKLVFVDFTADWCITCKVNERAVLDRDPVQAAMRARGVVKLKADWTRRDDRIRAILQAHGKAGVPMYLVYRPEAPQAPQVLPELLSPELVLSAIR